MSFNYSCCDFCPFDYEHSFYFGEICENCQAKEAERRLLSKMADLSAGEE